MTDTVTMIITILLVMIIVCGGLMVGDIRAMRDVRTLCETMSTEAGTRYIYTILGKSPTNSIVFKYIETDTELTYAEIKDIFPSIKVMSISVLDTKEGKF